jgi:hypothetical protein
MVRTATGCDSSSMEKEIGAVLEEKIGPSPLWNGNFNAAETVLTYRDRFLYNDPLTKEASCPHFLKRT